MFLVRIDGVGRMLTKQEYLSRHDFYLIVWDFLLIGSSFLLEKFFNYFSMVQYCFLFFFSLLFPFICTALFILNVKIKIWYHLKFEDIGICICVYRYMCYTCHVQIFFVFFIQMLCRYLLISFFFYRNFYSSFSHCYEFKLNKTGI